MRDRIDDLIFEEFLKAVFTQAEILRYNRMKALGLIKPKEKTFTQKVLEEIKLKIHEN